MDMKPNTPARANDRHDATTEGRMVLALEMIADELRSIGQNLSLPGRRIADEGPIAEAMSRGNERRANDRWENEGGSFEQELDPDPEIKRTTIEHFAVGGYNYTDLQHAIAEAKRARRARAGV
jgi:hypothetical protein